MHYKELLSKFWQKHLKEKTTDAPSVISTFAGCGGSSLGYSMSGFRELLAVEWDISAAKTFSMNFPDVAVYNDDIANLSVADCLAITGLKKGELDVLDGSPPCQGFSVAGRREIFDPRNYLFLEYVRLLKGLMPKVFLMENVPGINIKEMRVIFTQIISKLMSCGYSVSFEIMNAKFYRVPQTRERMIVIGIRQDLMKSPTFPNKIPGVFTIKDIFPNALGIKAREKGRLNCDFAPTITRRDGGYCLILQNGEIRKLTVEELGILSSFPIEFQWRTDTDARKQIGNAVPPLLIQALASHIKSNYL